jgi:predicted nucleic acid-binding Zn ribbon protein
MLAQPYVKVCPQCRANFQAVRNDARFCSGKCRTAHSRTLKRVTSGEILYGVPPLYNRAIDTIRQHADDSWFAIRIMSEKWHDIKSVKFAILVSWLAVVQLAGDNTTNGLYAEELVADVGCTFEWNR